MKNSTKAALLSGLVFPGIGHLRLKHYVLGIAWMAIFSGNLYIISTNAARQASAIIDKVLSGDIPLDSATILAAVTKSSSTSESMLLQISSITIVVAWVGSIVDAYIVGRKRDLAETAKRNTAREAN